MNRRNFLKAAATSAALATIPQPLLAAEPPRRKPNIIFFIADDMMADMQSFRPEGKGKALAPNLDRLAAGATILWGQHIVSPVCTPSRYNCLTGRYASRARNAGFQAMTQRAGMTLVTWNTQVVPSDVTLPRLLQQAGYATGMVGKCHAVAAPGRQKISPDADPRSPAVVAQLKRNAKLLKEAILASGFDFAESIYNGNAEEIGPDPLCVHNMEWVAKAGLDFIDANKDKPFYLYFAPTLCHSPYPKDRSWGADPLATPEGFLDKPIEGVLPPRSTIPQRLKAAGITGRHREMVLWMDDALGSLLKKLEQHNLLDDTIILFFNDNGQEGKGSIYQSAAHAPSFIWRKSGFACGREDRTRITNLDFAPTLLDLAGAPIPADAFDGVSFKPILDGRPTTLHETIYFELGFTRGILKGNWKYIALRYPPDAQRFATDKAPKHMQGRQVPPGLPNFGHLGGNNNEINALRTQPAYFEPDQLYDLSADPREQKNLAKDPAHADKLAEMKAELRKYLIRLPGGFAELNASAG